MLNRKITLIMILIAAILSISAVNAIDSAQNSTAIADDSHAIANESDSIGEVQSSNDSSKSIQNTDKSSGEVKSATITSYKLKTTYASGKYFKAKVVDSKTKKPLSNVKLILKVYTGKKFKKITKTTDANGIVKYYASTLSIGTHKVVVNVKDSKQVISKVKSSFIKISKAKPSIAAPKITAYLKENKRYKITIKNRESKKPMKNIRVMIKVYTGKKYKRYSLKTNSDGIVSFNAKSLTKGNHKIAIKIKATSKVKSASSKSSVKIVARPKTIKLKVNGHVLNVKLENNAATKALLKRLKEKGSITVNAEDYGDFEKVGDLGFSLPRSDRYITTSSGDIVLYEGSEISIFYNANSWSYTKLGKVQNVKDLKRILGPGNVKLVLSLK